MMHVTNTLLMQLRVMLFDHVISETSSPQDSENISFLHEHFNTAPVDFENYFAFMTITSVRSPIPKD